MHTYVHTYTSIHKASSSDKDHHRRSSSSGNKESHRSNRDFKIHSSTISNKERIVVMLL